MIFQLEDFWIHENDDGKSVYCEVDLVMTEPSSPDIMPSLNDPGEPGYPAQFEIHEIRLTDVPFNHVLAPENTVLTLNESQFISFFENGQEAVNDAYEWASEQEIDSND